MNPVLRTQLSGVSRRPARLLLTGLAVLVASFVVYATVLAQQITERSLLNGLSGTPEATDLVVREGTVTGAQLARIAAVPGVAEAAGRLEVGVQAGAEYLTVAADPGTGPLSMVAPVSGRYPAAAGELAVTPRTVQRLGLTTGSEVELRAGDETPPVTARIVGVVEPPSDYGDTAYAPLGTVSALVTEDVLQRVEIRLDAGADATAVREGIAAVVAGPEAPEVATGADVRLEEAQAMVGEINQMFAVVGMFVAVAVAAAGLIAASTFRIVFAQRMRQLALLRAVGAGRSALVRALVVEGLLTGVVAGLTGVLAALAVGHTVRPAAGALGVDVASPGFPLAAAAATVALAVLITVLAVLAPAFSAARVSPLEALRTAATTGARTGIGGGRRLFGLLFTAAALGGVAVVLAALPEPDAQDFDPSPLLLGIVASGACAYIALIALGPVLVRPVLVVAGWPLRRLGPVGRLAVGGVGGSARRAAAVSVVVALGVTLIAGTLVGGASVQVLAERELAASAPADFELSASDGTGLPPGYAGRAAASGALTRVTPYRRIDTTVGGVETAATDLALTALPRLADLDLAAGTTDGFGPGRTVIARYVADLANLRVGDTTAVTAGGRTVRLTVSGILSDMGPLHSGLVVDGSDLTGLGAKAAPTGLLADASADGEQARTAGLHALRDLTAGDPRYGVAVLADQRDQLRGNLTVVLAIAIALIGLTVLIAVVGVGATTALSVVERVRESGLLRAVGMSRGGLRTMLTTESALYGVVGAALGIALGVPYAWLAVRATGLNAPLTVPGWQLAAVFAALVALTALAGVMPARRAARVSPVTALTTD
ncbi:FtsX-like permease family protein [Actinoplanes rectilineatus]|uniref:FtsX-like permease family protein n=1 Tax=Actinoplanes rectilineatus TaxID=113571 RepID=UPI0005F2E99B|nr:FtsX-like permease family protein [Actinoplanes rectilineatus]